MDVVFVGQGFPSKFEHEKHFRPEMFSRRRHWSAKISQTFLDTILGLHCEDPPDSSTSRPKKENLINFLLIFYIIIVCFTFHKSIHWLVWLLLHLKL